MSRIVQILRAAHCRSTHHYFAIDALERIETASGKRLGRLLLKYHDDYLIGAKAPDKSFKDFKNHVIHVTDGYWGGAAEACEQWLSKSVEALDAGKWKKAAYALGVLSHYFTDPLMPLHTDQNEREKVVHRPLEWSVCKSYEEILALSRQYADGPRLQFATSERWISEAVVQGAELAHAAYDSLVLEYDIALGSSDPPAGLNSKSRRRLAQIFDVTLDGWAQVLARIADQTTANVPDFSLSLTTLLATIDMPLAWIVRKISDAGEQRVVRQIFKEFLATGTVKHNLPPEIRSVAKARVSDPHLRSTPSQPRPVDAKPAAGGQLASSQTPPSQPAADAASTSKDLFRVQLPGVSVGKSTLAQPRSHANATAGGADERANTAQSNTEAQPLHFQPMQPTMNSEHESPPVAAESSVVQSEPEPQSTSETRPSTGVRSSVDGQSDIVDAPSIGPKTARRFHKIGITTIGQFVSADAVEMEAAIATSWITAQLLRDWQAQAQLVCDVPALCGYKAQLLVAADCRIARDLAASEPSELYCRIEEVCESLEGQRILRRSKPPTREDVGKWINSARLRHSRAPWFPVSRAA